MRPWQNKTKPYFSVIENCTSGTDIWVSDGPELLLPIPMSCLKQHLFPGSTGDSLSLAGACSPFGGFDPWGVCCTLPSFLLFEVESRPPAKFACGNNYKSPLKWIIFSRLQFWSLQDQTDCQLLWRRGSQSTPCVCLGSNLDNWPCNARALPSLSQTRGTSSQERTGGGDRDPEAHRCSAHSMTNVCDTSEY